MVELSGTGRIGDVVVLADGRDRVSVSAKVLDAVARRYDDAADLSTRFATYGRTTGVGANRLAAIPAEPKTSQPRPSGSEKVIAVLVSIALLVPAITCSSPLRMPASARPTISLACCSWMSPA